MTAAAAYLPAGGKIDQNALGMLAKSVTKPTGTSISVVDPSILYSNGACSRHLFGPIFSTINGFVKLLKEHPLY